MPLDLISKDAILYSNANPVTSENIHGLNCDLQASLSNVRSGFIGTPRGGCRRHPAQ